MGMLFQGGALFDSYTVEENVMFPLNMFTKLSFEENLNSQRLAVLADVFVVQVLMAL